MKNDKLQELLDTRRQSDEEIEKLRSLVTILFSDIKGSTSYAEEKGDVEYMAMINRHNHILFPVIEAEGGSVVKTIGDSILAKFDDPVAGIRAAAGMQRALAKDREGREAIEQIRIRIGLHYGMGLVKDNDVFGDVVNAASRIENQAQAEQILIADALLDAARAAGFECAKMGRAELRGKNEPIDLYAVAWSESATRQLIEEVQARYEKTLKETKREHAQLEEEFDNARELWRSERRGLNAEIEDLEKSIEHATQTARQQLSENLQSESRFQIEELIRSRELMAEDLASAHQKFEAERNNLKAQIASMEASFIDAMERSNNPARMAMNIREQVEARVMEAKQGWQLQWEGERNRLVAEIERLKKTAPVTSSNQKEAARRAVLEKLGKLPPGSSRPGVKTADEWEREFENAKFHWDIDRDRLNLNIKKLETDLQQVQDLMRNEILKEVRGQYDLKLDEANRERQRLEQDIQSITSELASERQRLTARIKAIEEVLPQAQQVARKQAMAEMQSEFDLKLDEATRLRSRIERKHQELVAESEDDRRRANKQIAALEEQLRQAKETAYKAQKSSSRAISPG